MHQNKALVYCAVLYAQLLIFISYLTDADYHEQEKIINQLRMRVAVLEQEIKDKEQVLTKSTDLLGAEQDKKVKFKFGLGFNSFQQLSLTK